ncbi:MAG: WYL domain-containing protein [Chloroflexi bacterium]|nr:WYL domain-containing protein [Chloroflexota bacterium]
MTPHPLTDRPIAEVPLAVVDVETTGLSPERGDRVIEVAVLRAEPGVDPRLFGSLVDPGRPIDPSASAVNGIRASDLVGKPRFVELIDGLSQQLEGAVLVAHNAAFDLSFLKAEFALVGRRFPDLPIVDTLLLARERFRFPSNRLVSVASALGVKPSGAHRAAADVLTTHGILLRMIDALAERGVRTVGELQVAQGVGPGGFAPTLTEPLATAVREHRAITIVYRSSGRPAMRRVVEPIGTRGPYLIAYCRLRKAERTFRIDRIEAAYWP